MNLEELRSRAAAGDETALAPLAAALDRSGQSIEATDVLSSAANRGSFEARYLVGLRLLIGSGAPLLPRDGIRLIAESVERSAGAAHMLGVLAMLGAYVRQDWERALMLLQLAAEQKSALAQRELALLSRDRELAATALQDPMRANLWGQLRAAVDTDEWNGAPKSHELSGSPQIVQFEKLVSPEVCMWLIDRARGRLQRARIYSGAAPRVDNYRSNTSAEFNLVDSDFITAFIQVRIAKAAGLPLNQLEVLAVLHYSTGEEFADHFDFVDPRSPDATRDIANLGQRIVTFLIYLNDEYTGGDTAFPRLGISHKGAAGDALLFSNVIEDGSPDLRTLHAGRQPLTSEKWIASQFIRGRPVIPGTSPPN